MLTVYKSRDDEPLMCSASKYVKQSESSDVGTELVKILGENRYLRQKLEEVCVICSVVPFVCKLAIIFYAGWMA